MGKLITNVAQVVGALVFVGWCASRSDKSESGSASSATPNVTVVATPPEKTTAARVASDFEKNEVSAEDYYRGRCFDVSGTVDHIDAGVGETATLRLRGGIMGVLVADVPSAFAKTLSVGSAVTMPVMGVSEVLGQPIARSNRECINQSHAADEAATAAREATRRQASAKRAVAPAR